MSSLRIWKICCRMCTKVSEAYFLNDMVLANAISPIRPGASPYSLRLSLAAALTLGIILALFAVFFAKFWQKYKEYKGNASERP